MTTLDEWAEPSPQQHSRQAKRWNSNDSVIISQATEDVLDNVPYGCFCDSKEIRVAFFLAAGPLAASL
jgi:hypothetical protein